ncbi:TrbC family F-type conjugative pilus assembly protein [Alteromonas macleodii]|uniref:Type-F conjugative transfer system pilin assembly family protein n=1 Tax=Alteromonas macleodii TaxID=28108 RepID=A0AB36FL57_ALTMA|nr:TrbC family F-type conjugative pilus assembly protein [Alteromonas macleodii]OES24222.1 type-F conjugative transfer system pilin assembly family protein [Alteromonas macleodii]OES24853.1 type-F conjugative transfer system pilin assembly family protein [Alteromonas macleodii]OES25131.1 type-F conjugative transfer system pilin assembly family protein [Alteromonas macleodii]OES39173.1 type-F conjugative transfer system pilin assembly family protein [Alteromonas macleodii]
MKRLIALLTMAVATCAVAQDKPAEDKEDQNPKSALQRQYEQQYKGVIDDLTRTLETKDHPMVQRAEQAYREFQSSDVAGAFVDSVREKAGEDGDTSGVLLFFFSSSMPEHTIKAYLAQAEKINQHIIFVIRGTVDNSIRLMPTIKYLQEIKTFDGCGKSLCQRAVNTVVDPRFFEQYRITTVPAIAYTGEFSNFGYFDNHALPDVTDPTVIVGEATLPFLVKTLAEEINDENLNAIAEAYQF